MTTPLQKRVFMPKKPESRGPGKGRSYVSTAVDKELADMIDDRARALGWSRGKFLREIMVRWRELGCPPVSDLDRLLQEKQEKAKDYSQDLEE